MKVVHELKPIFDKNSKILILGSIPSACSRETRFYYGHSQNKFWYVLANIFKEEIPKTNHEKEKFLKKHNIALWDVLKECEITGSSDSSIKNPVPNDINYLLSKTKVKTIFVTGRTAEKYYKKFCEEKTNIKGIYLPSTSPANASIKYDQLLKSYQIILNYLK